MAWTAPRTWVTGEVVVAATGNAHWRDNLRFLKGIDGTISLDAPIKGGTASGTFYMEYEALVSASVVAIASATAGRQIYSSADRLFVYTDGTAHRAIPGIPRTAATGQVLVAVGSGTFGFGTAPASADANKAWVTLGSASTGTWAAVNLGQQVVALTTLGTFVTTTTTAFQQVTGYSGSLTFTGSRTFIVGAQHNGYGGSGGAVIAARLLIDSTQVAIIETAGSIAPADAIPQNAIITGVGTGGSGDHTFALQLRAGAGGTGQWGYANGAGNTAGATAGVFYVVAYQ